MDEVETQEQYPQIGQDNLIPPIDRKEEAAEIGIIRELSPKKVLEQLRMNLKGFYFDYETEKYVRVMNPLMNEKGISKYLSIVSSVVTDLVTFSNYKDEEINNLVLFVCDQAIPTIHINYKEYGIAEKSDLQIINIQLFNYTLAAFRKAMAAGDRSVVRGTTQEKIGQGYYYAPEGNQSKRGRFNPFSRN